MTKPKSSWWLNLLAGLLFLLAGMRDLFAPGFFSISGRPVSSISAVIYLVLGTVLLVLGITQTAGNRKAKNYN